MEKVMNKKKPDNRIPLKGTLKFKKPRMYPLDTTKIKTIEDIILIFKHMGMMFQREKISNKDWYKIKHLLVGVNNEHN